MPENLDRAAIGIEKQILGERLAGFDLWRLHRYEMIGASDLKALEERFSGDAISEVYDVVYHSWIGRAALIRQFRVGGGQRYLPNCNEPDSVMRLVEPHQSLPVGPGAISSSMDFQDSVGWMARNFFQAILNVSAWKYVIAIRPPFPCGSTVRRAQAHAQQKRESGQGWHCFKLSRMVDKIKSVSRALVRAV
jgi:hypothetical protein